jgi:hypothetical protein
MATLVTRDINEAKMGFGNSAFGESLESGGRFCVGAFGRNLASVAVKLFARLLYAVKKLDSLSCTLSVRFTERMLQ